MGHGCASCFCSAKLVILFYSAMDLFIFFFNYVVYAALGSRGVKHCAVSRVDNVRACPGLPDGSVMYGLVRGCRIRRLCTGAAGVPGAVVLNVLL